MRKKTLLKPSSRKALLCVLGAGACLLSQAAFAREMFEQPRIKLRSLEKTTARTMTFEADVGSTLKFGSLFIKVQSCQKSSPVERPEAAAFLQIWEEAPEGAEKAGDEAESQWVFSGWMFSSAPALSPMDHPIYDVWVMDCMGAEGEPTVTAAGSEDVEGGAGLAENAEQPPETKDFNSLLQGITGVSDAPAEGADNGDAAPLADDSGLKTPTPPTIAEPEAEDIIEDETIGLPGSE